MKRILIILFVLALCFCQRRFNPVEVQQDNYWIINESCLCYRKLDAQNHWQIYITNIQGSKEYNISNNPYNDAYSPRWSPDGKFIIFRYDKPLGGPDIYRYDVLNKTKINLTGDLADNESAYPVTWTFDSEKIIFVYHKIGESEKVWSMKKDGTNKKEILPGNYNILGFYNDGTTFLYETNHFLYKGNIEGALTEMVLDLDQCGKYRTYVNDFDPNSNKILCHEDTSRWDGGYTFIIKTIDLNTFKTDTIVTNFDNYLFYRPVFSNDYQKIAFIARNYNKKISKIILWQNDSIKDICILNSKKDFFDITPLKFSPSDNFIACTKNTNQSNNSDFVYWISHVWLININDQNYIEIGIGEDIHWNPTCNN